MDYFLNHFCVVTSCEQLLNNTMNNSQFERTITMLTVNKLRFTPFVKVVNGMLW